MTCWSGRFTPPALLSAVAVILVSHAGLAHADTMSTWSYSWDRTPTSLPSGTVESPGVGSIVTLAGEPGTVTGNANFIKGVILSTAGSQVATDPADTYTDAKLMLTLSVTGHTGDMHDFNFGVAFNGQVSATVSDLTPTITDATQSHTFGDTIYTVKLDNYKAPGAYASVGAEGHLGASVTLTKADGTNGGGNNGGGSGNNGGGGNGGPVTVSDAPEPTTLVLAGLSVPAVAAAWLRRRRAAKAAA